jgi:hypothetical protein
MTRVRNQYTKIKAVFERTWIYPRLCEYVCEAWLLLCVFVELRLRCEKFRDSCALILRFITIRLYFLSPDSAAKALAGSRVGGLAAERKTNSEHF